MQLVISDSDQVCDALQAGHWPSGAVILMATLKHNRREDRDAAFRRGTYPVRGSGQLLPQDTKRAFFLSLDDACAPGVQQRASGGEIVLASDAGGDHGVLEGDLALQFDSGALTGHFRATYCEPSDEEPRGCR